MLEALTAAVQAEFADSEFAPVIITKAIVMCQAMGDDGETRLYTWSSDDTLIWDIVGMCELMSAGARKQYLETE
jgi:hypothetical protein